MSLPPRIALIGFMASGKSTVGRLLAERLRYRFVDLDDEVEKRAGKKIPDIFRDSGEAAFRSLESECLADLAESMGIVIATGGGAPQQAANGDFFVRAATFFLDVSLATAQERAGSAEGSRPLLMRDRASIGALYESRLPVYRALGRTVETEKKSPAEIAEEIYFILSPTTPERGPYRTG
jgi:shikimate kinase